MSRIGLRSSASEARPQKPDAEFRKHISSPVMKTSAWMLVFLSPVENVEKTILTILMTSLISDAVVQIYLRTYLVSLF